jgi:heme exporter protein C
MTDSDPIARLGEIEPVPRGRRGPIIALVAGAVAAVFLPTAVYMAFFLAPLQDTLYFNQKIFYFHVPPIMMMFLAVIVCGVASALHLRGRGRRWDDLARSSAELAIPLGIIMLATGSIWGKAAWNQWWDWNVRLTTALLLWMIMLAYVVVRKFGGPSADRLASGLGVFGTILIPFVYVSVNVWRNVHPDTSVVPGLRGDMLWTFLISIVGFLALFILMLSVLLEQRRTEWNLAIAREVGLDEGILG